MTDVLTMPEQLIMLHACCLGIYICFLYDLLRTLRRIVRHNRRMVTLEDICFWAYCAVKMFLYLYHVSNGKCRWFSIVGAIMSMCIYEKLLGRHFVYGMPVILTKMKRLFRKNRQKKR